jgi:flagellar biosynthesis protein FlhF
MFGVLPQGGAAMTPSGKAYSFVADSAAEAVAQIRAKLGPEALVVNVRKLPAEGLARLWQKPRIEVVARLETEPQTTEPQETEEQGTSIVLAQLEALRREMGEMRRRIEPASGERQSEADAAGPEARFAPVPERMSFSHRETASSRTSLVQYLQTIGLGPISAGLVEDRVLTHDADAAQRPLGEQAEIANRVLESFWRPAPDAIGGLHVLVGPAGSGKTTALCKWLTQASLIEGRLASLWRLDGVTANQAEHLSVHGEILGVPVERSWPGSLPLGDIGFIDLPGVDWRDRGALQELRRVVDRFGGDARVHLVLNGAYESDTLLAQARAFSALPIVDTVVTHLDEELRWSKLWNLVLGTNLPISFLGAGQNLPGFFERATSRKLLARPAPRSGGGKALFSAGSPR